MASGGRSNDRAVTGTVVPNRIFVGGIAESVTDEDLRKLFSKYGNVKATKIIIDNKTGEPRGYGFVTFETEEEAQRVINNPDRPILKDKRLNIERAIKKQPYGRGFGDGNSTTSLVWPGHQFAGNATGLSRESLYYPQTSWPFMWPQFYLQQQCHYPPTAAAQSGYPQYVYSIAQPSDYPYQSSVPVANSDYSETSSADSGEFQPQTQKIRPKLPSSTSDSGRQDSVRQMQPKVSTSSQSSTRFSTGAETPPSYVQTAPVHHLHPPVFAKTVNGVTVMAYPSSFMMGNPAYGMHVKEGGSESDNVFSELSFLHSPLTSGALTPPPTPLVSMSCDFGPDSIRESVRKN